MAIYVTKHYRMRNIILTVALFKLSAVNHASKMGNGFVADTSQCSLMWVNY